jgi:hypothetical protein
MLTQTDIATFDRRYRRFRAELRIATRIEPAAVAAWMRPRRDQLAASYQATGEDGSLLDFEAYVRHQYARAMGLAS